MPQVDLDEVVSQALDDFYRRRLQKLTELKLKKTLRNKNPYLFKAVGVKKASELVEQLLQAFMSSSDETIFGDAFFEPVVKAACSGTAATGAGVDVTVEKDDSYTVISVKSGPHWGNSSQLSKLKDNFACARHVFDNKKLRKHFRAILGHCYGRSSLEPNPKRPYSVRSGQAFWEELTDDPDFYLKLIRLIDKQPETHRVLYEAEWSRAVNRFEKEFLNNFSTPSGDIDWDKLVEFNSGKMKSC
jgi:hypothetical protein